MTSPIAPRAVRAVRAVRDDARGLLKSPVFLRCSRNTVVVSLRRIRTLLSVLSARLWGLGMAGLLDEAASHLDRSSLARRRTRRRRSEAARLMHARSAQTRSKHHGN
jgi:hypothetical protein